MPPAAAIAGAAVVGAGASIISGNKAAKAQKQAADASAANERYFYDTARADQAPYRQTGYGALAKLAAMYGVQQRDAAGKSIGGTGANDNLGYVGDGGFTTSPGYQFRLSEGIKAAERSAAARGALASGGTIKAIQRYGEGLASDEYNNYANRLAALAGVGQTATNATQQAGAQAASGISNAVVQAGNARASSYANTGSAINSGVNNLASLYLYQQGGGFGGSTYGGTPPIYGGTLGGVY